MLTEEIANAQCNHSPYGFEEHRTECEWSSNQLTNSQTSHTRFDAHFGDNFIGNNATNDDTNAADSDGNTKQPPTQIHIREIDIVIQICIVSKGHAAAMADRSGEYQHQNSWLSQHFPQWDLFGTLFCVLFANSLTFWFLKRCSSEDSNNNG